MPSRPPAHSLALIVATVIAGLVIRFVPIGLPPFIVKYGGSTLWALMVYWIVSTFLPSWRLFRVALFTGALTAAIEFFKLYHSPTLDAFRLTLPGILLLGRSFSVWDIIAYWLAISIGVFSDKRIRPIKHSGCR
jgi:carbon starvation protein CstA